LPHHLVVLSDLSRTLRDEERKAWQRLIRVLGHELNNSLAPIQSVAQGLESELLNASKSSELQSEASVSILDDSGRALASFALARKHLAALWPHTHNLRGCHNRSCFL